MAKMTVRQNEAAGAQGERARMLKDLHQALEEVDDEGLLFLLRQAQVLIHNARVEKLNRESAALREGTPARKKAGGAAARSGKAAEAMRAGVEIEEKGSSIFLTIGEARKVMTREEMQRLVRICYGAESKSEALRQLYTVLARERNDILFDARIPGPASPLMDGLFHAVRSAYRLKER